MNKLTPLLLIGAGGHALACIDVIEAQRKYAIRGLVGMSSEKGSSRLGYPVLGTDEDLPTLTASDIHALVCVGQIRSPDLRILLFSKLQQLGCVLPTVVSPMAWVSPHASIGAGSIVMHGAIINAGARVGNNCIINSRSLIEHGASVADHCHVSTAAVLNGDVSVGEGSFIGSGGYVKEGVRIGERCVVGLGTTVFYDLSDKAICK